MAGNESGEEGEIFDSDPEESKGEGDMLTEHNEVKTYLPLIKCNTLTVMYVEV